MFRFNMSIDDNFASFKDEKTNSFVFIDSFDNQEFNVRLGTVDYSKEIGIIYSDSTEDLNNKLHSLVSKY